MIDWIAPPTGTPLQAWRHRVLAAVLLGMVVFGGLAYMPSAWLAWTQGERTVVLIDTVVYALLIGLIVARALPYTVRAVAIVTTAVLLGTYFLVGFGFEAAGFLWVMSFPIMAAVLLGLRASIICLGVTAAMLIVLGLFLEQGAFPWANDMPNALEMWAVSAISLMMLASLVSVSIGVLFEGLGREAMRRVEAERETARLAGAVEQSDGLVLLIDLDGHITYANRTARDMLGDSLAPAELPQWSALHAGDAWDGSLHVLRSDGVSVLLSGTMSPVRDDDGQQTHVLATFRDVRRERELEERLQQGQKLEAIGTLAGGIAHDFNNLLQPIVLNTESAQEQLDAHHPAQSMLDDVRQSAERARALVRRILTFTRGMEHDRRPIELAPLLEQTVRLLRATLPQNVLVISEGSPGVVVNAESGELQQVFLNLSTNASHAMPEGGTLELQVASVACASHEVLRATFPGTARVACVTVRDSGAGMEASVLERAFEPFFTTKGPGRGTGLGLAMVHGTVTALGGLVVPQSTPGLGTTMRVYLPLAASPPEERARTPSAVPTIGERVVFLIDDEVAVLTATTRLLERLGWQVIACSDPQTAVQTLQSEDFHADCIVTDLSMPGVSGLQLAQIAREQHAHIPVVLTTGFLEHDELARTVASGISQVVRKPFSSRELQQALDAAWHGRVAR